MFCPNCGTTVNKKLKYCNACGERLSKAAEIDKDGTPGKMLDNILTGIVLVVIFGLGIMVGLVAVLLANNLQIEPVIIIVLAYLAAIFGICYTLVRQVPKLIDARLKTLNQPDEPADGRTLRPVSVGQLEEFREPAMSVTDRTTKTLEEAPLKRN